MMNVVNSVADLKLIIGTNNDAIQLLGYYSPGSGGGGVFYYDSSSNEIPDDGMIIQPSGTTSGRWKRLYSGSVSVKWFGAKGNGSANDTSAINKAAAYCTTRNSYLNFEDGLYAISETIVLQCSAGFESNSYSATTSGFVAIVDNLFPALRLNGFFVQWNNICINMNGKIGIGIIIGDDLSADGSSFSGGCTVTSMRVWNCNGIGLLMIAPNDCTFDSISVELCGNAGQTEMGTSNLIVIDNYALAIVGTPNGTLSTAECSFTRIQCEEAGYYGGGRAIFIHDNALSNKFSKIHSERARAVTGNNTWHFSGQGCDYSAVRLNANGTNATNGLAFLGGSNNHYSSILVEQGPSNSVMVEAAGINASGNVYDSLSAPNLKQMDGQYAKLIFNGGSITQITGHSIVGVFTGSRIGTLNAGFANFDVKRTAFYSCEIGTVASIAGDAAASFFDCQIGSYLGLQAVFFDNSDIKNTSTISLSYSTVSAVNSRFHNTVESNYCNLEFHNIKILGNFNYIGGGRNFRLSNVSVTGTASSAYSAVPNSGNWYLGERTEILNVVTHGFVGYICTVAGVGSAATFNTYGPIA